MDRFSDETDGVPRMSTAPRNVRGRDRALLRCLGWIPARLARHVLFLLNTVPSLADRWGYHIRPIHFYEPLPDFRVLNEQSVGRRRESTTIEFDFEAQLRLVRELASKYRDEVSAFEDGREHHGVTFSNGYFDGLDVAVYYAVIRHLRPSKVVEIGAGFSSRVADFALKRNRAEGSSGRLVCIEPYPSERLTEGVLDVELVQRPVEEVDLAVFRNLRENDVLFIDSSHTVKLGGDVIREILEILPCLAPGVWIHIHDIFIPHDYPADWVIDRRLAFTEQYLLEAFLSYNSKFSIQLANHWLEADYGAEVRALWSRANVAAQGGSPSSSFWLRKDG